jgi:hypothetical protein
MQGTCVKLIASTRIEQYNQTADNLGGLLNQKDKRLAIIILGGLLLIPIAIAVLAAVIGAIAGLFI